MAKKNTTKDMTTDDMIKLLAVEQEKVRANTFGAGITRQKNVKEGRASKKLIAQLKTKLQGLVQAK
jgi:hypothetical protein